MLLSGIAEVYVKNRYVEREEVLEIVREEQLIDFPALANFLREKDELILSLKTLKEL